MKKIPFKFFLSILAVFSLTLPAAVVLAEDTPPPLAEMWLITPKQGQELEFRKALAEHMKFRSEHSDPRAWQTYTPMLGDNLNQFAIRFCCFNWADQDSYEAWGAGAEEIHAHFQEHVAPLADHWEHYFESMDWPNSHWVDAANGYKYFAVTEFHLMPGSGPDFDAARDKMSQIAINQGWANNHHPWIWASVIGGPATESIIIPHENFASFDRSDEDFASFLSRNLGSEAAAELMKQFSSASGSTSYQIWEYHEDLSMSTDN